MEDIGAVSKSKRNTQGAGFMYRGIDDVMNALNPAMAKHKLFVVPEILEQIREERTSKAGGGLTYSICKIKYTFYAEDGTNVSATVIGEAMDSGDKSTNKSMSIAFKYACFQVFCIPTEEMIDPDAEQHQVTKKVQKTKPSIPIKPTEPVNIPQPDISMQKVNSVKVKVVMDELNRTGISAEAICSRYKIKEIADITEEIFPKVVSALNKTKTKEVKINE